MKAQDWANPDENRKIMLEQLSNLCNYLGLSYNYTEKKFTIDLPEVVEQMVIAPHPKTKRISLDAFDHLSDWLATQNSDQTDILPDELPPIDEQLNEGEKPETDDTPDEDKPIKL